MKLSNFIAGLAILREHFTDQDGYHLSAEHDEIGIYPTDTPLSPDEVKRMHALGWWQVGQDSEAGEYSHDESWGAFA